MNEVENVISSSVHSCNPRAWNEDHISYTWLQGITQNFRDVTITDIPSCFSMAWDAYKADGVLEEDHGDIAILIRLTFPKQKSLTGVAFLEAKRRYTSGGYTKLNWKQLEYQSSKVSNHQILLYDNQPTDACVINLLKQGFCHLCFSIPYQSTQAIVVPTPHVLALRSRAKKINSLGLPLAYKICCRYLQGLDLDFSSQLVSDVQSGVLDGVKYLLVAHVAQGDTDEPTTQSIEINRERYRRLPYNDRN
ncbi:hypothetical protein RIF25_00150 [Thermosynechococcaceae cyanobacterium BACA0444]|uniref:Uncharacterized protein n=1 Tax=Pseudocalidococcus azoricus BACA0444 TaxID=2918990 RepID=A0AAE4FNG1_9CYAN|nr:hypothetical protein [Pseudocalidococcus azoricus]MDS3859205.1 hypothetical protein [Pseudocalidococcus azoricus BACA0444]